MEDFRFVISDFRLGSGTGDGRYVIPDSGSQIGKKWRVHRHRPTATTLACTGRAWERRSPERSSSSPEVAPRKDHSPGHHACLHGPRLGTQIARLAGDRCEAQSCSAGPEACAGQDLPEPGRPTCYPRDPGKRYESTRCLAERLHAEQLVACSSIGPASYFTHSLTYSFWGRSRTTLQEEWVQRTNRPKGSPSVPDNWHGLIAPGLSNPASRCPNTRGDPSCPRSR